MQQSAEDKAKPKFERDRLTRTTKEREKAPDRKASYKQLYKITERQVRELNKAQMQ